MQIKQLELLWYVMFLWVCEALSTWVLIAVSPRVNKYHNTVYYVWIALETHKNPLAMANYNVV